MIILSKEVTTIVKGIKNSTQSEGTLKTSSILKANVMECPIVNAVTSINIFFQSLYEYTAINLTIALGLDDPKSIKLEVHDAETPKAEPTSVNVFPPSVDIWIFKTSVPEGLI